MLLYEDVRLTYAERSVLSLIDYPRKLFGVSGDFYVLKKPALCVKAKKRTSCVKITQNIWMIQINQLTLRKNHTSHKKRKKNIVMDRIPSKRKRQKNEI